MSDMPEFRAWADSAHKDSLRPIKVVGRPLFRCSACQHRSTKNQAKASGGICTHCRGPLRAFSLFAKEPAS